MENKKQGNMVLTLSAQIASEQDLEQDESGL
jgi:hypothetical protein